MTQKKIIHLEDDFRYAEQVKGYLVTQFHAAGIELVVQRIPTESDFLEWLEAAKAHPETRPDAVVMDTMVRWANPLPDALEPPEEVLNEGYHRAGIRSARKLAKELPGVPLIFLTITDATDHAEAFAELQNAGLPFKCQNKSEDAGAFFGELKQLLGI